MDIFLNEELTRAIQNSEGLHSSCISRDYLNLFIRVAKEDPSFLSPLVTILSNNMAIERTNVQSSLYICAKLLDANSKFKEVLLPKISIEKIQYYANDSDRGIAANATILLAVLNGKKLTDFPEENSNKHQNSNQNNNTTLITGSILIGSNINSGTGNQNVEVHNVEKYDEETKQMILSLKEAIEKKDHKKIKEIASFLLDKGTDLAISLLTGLILTAGKH